MCMTRLPGRLKVNIGNIYFKQRQFAKAIKNYRMALDQVPTNTHSSMKYVSVPLSSSLSVSDPLCFVGFWVTWTCMS